METNGTNLTAARRRVIRQLIESMLHEGILEQKQVKNRIHEGTAPVPGTECLWSLLGTSRDGKVVEYRFQAYAAYGFNRIRILTPVMRVEEKNGDMEGCEAVSIPLMLSELLSEELLVSEGERLAHFIKELEHTVRNDSFHPLQETKSEHRYTLTELEALTSTGHPYHPSYKSRIGFNLQDHQDYAPEFAPIIQLEWIAVHRSYAEAHTLSTINYEELVEDQLGPECMSKLSEQLRAAGRDTESYLLIPVHPWQWKNVLSYATVSLQEQGILVRLGPGSESYQPLQSIRTLANVSAPEKPNVKLSIQIMNTSALRIIGPHHVRNASAISEWLHQIWSEDKYLREHCRVIILREIGGSTLVYEALPLPQERLLNGSMSAVFRESIERMIGPGEEAVPYTLVTHRDAVNGKSVIQPWIEQYGLETWTRRLLEVTLQPLLHLLFCYGIGLEAHGQNMVLLHKKGWPERIALRDLPGGTCAVKSGELFPARPEVPELACRQGDPQHPILEEELEEVRNYWMDGLLHIQLYEVGLFLWEQFRLPEEQFWAFAAQEIQKYQQRFPDQEQIYRLFKLDAETVTVGRLTARKIWGDESDREHQVPNPLSPWLRQDKRVQEGEHAYGSLGSRR
ncbi:IucA/IucC family siderophore biosynthesis protein [Paenibacillus sp. J22TS3]|uniref:IucA/IucC family protein n=1 Tax=Paenibacillus sp. J22TS3 TaxID=2807192 RepID=UPI001BD0737F|nr:IucA/IucC family protein [Paenibacillus sp. J22TS3]